MTIFAVILNIFPDPSAAGGFYWLALPNQMQMWPNFRSPLLWDVRREHLRDRLAALLVPGDDPDLATLGPGGESVAKLVTARLPWAGGDRPGRHRYELAYLLLAALDTQLVLSVHWS